MKLPPVGGRFWLKKDGRTEINDEADITFCKICERWTQADHLYALLVLNDGFGLYLYMSRGILCYFFE
jgi:hypothetical protein